MKQARDAFVVTDGLVKTFNGRAVIDDLSFYVREGEITGLLGPNGSGKTTAVRLLNGVLRPDAGYMRVGGLDPMTHGDAVRAMSGVLTESADFYRPMSGLDNLLFFGRLYGVHDRDRCKELLDMFGLGPHRDKPVGTYSTGMRKRLGLAKAVIHQPKMLFLDEPTNGLDPEGVRLVLNYIRHLNATFGTTILVCSHLLNQMEAVCHRYLFIDGGRLIAQGSLDELRERYRERVDVDLEVDDVPGWPRGDDGASTTSQDAFGPATIHAVSDGTLGRYRMSCSVGEKERVPELLAALVQKTSVYSARIVEPDLETLYFKVREGRGDGRG